MAESEAGTTAGAGGGVDAEVDPDPDPENGGGDEQRQFSDRAKLGALIAVVGIVGTGVVDFALSQLGAPGVGGAAWAAGYGLTIIALWYVLLRPLDLG
jgi:hypothetical protein